MSLLKPECGMRSPIEVEVDVGFSVLEWPAGAWELWSQRGLNIGIVWNGHLMLLWFFSHGSQALSDASTFLTSSFQVLAKLQSIWAACIEHQLQPNASPWLSWETQAVNFTQNRNRLCGYAHGHNFVLINPLIIFVSRTTFGCVPQVITLLGIMTH
jgi:hypothetical protein